MIGHVLISIDMDSLKSTWDIERYHNTILQFLGYLYSSLFNVTRSLLNLAESLLDLTQYLIQSSSSVYACTRPLDSSHGQERPPLSAAAAAADSTETEGRSGTEQDIQDGQPPLSAVSGA